MSLARIRVRRGITMLTTLTAFTTLLTLALTPARAETCPSETGQTVWGAPIAVGDGTIQTFLITSDLGEPERFGVQFALEFESLPPEPPAHGPGHEYLLPVPDQAASLLPFDHVTADWNPHGHEPSMIYDVAHVDLHFYLLTHHQRAEITPGMCEGTPLSCDALHRATVPLSPSVLPPGYEDVGAVAPFMGNHLIDPRGPEFMGEPFTGTFVFGAWDGEVAFLEPMVSVDYFAALHGRVCRTISNPQTFADAGWYPNTYCVSTEDGAKTITLEDFEWYAATDSD